MVGFEVELIGFHTSDLNHLDPACPDCRHVRSVLFGIADALPSRLRKNSAFQSSVQKRIFSPCYSSL